MGRLLAAMDPNTIVIILSDHGFEHGLRPNGNYNHENAPPGVFLIAGNTQELKKGEAITIATVRDVVSTILHLFGLLHR